MSVTCFFADTLQSFAQRLTITVRVRDKSNESAKKNLTASVGHDLQRNLPDGLQAEFVVHGRRQFRCESVHETSFPGAEANAISPPKPAKARPAVGARVKVLTENEDKEGLYYDDDRVAWHSRTDLRSCCDTLNEAAAARLVRRE